MKVEENKLFIVGAGPGTPGLLTPDASRVIESCGCFAGGERLLELAPQDSKTFAIGADLDAAAGFIRENLERCDVCVLASGDPGCYGILPFLMRQFPEQIEVEPGISSVQLLAARLRIPWHDWELVSLHGRGDPGLGMPGTQLQGNTLYFCDNINTPQYVASLLRVLIGDSRAVCGSDLGMENESVIDADLRTIAGKELPANSLLLVLPQPRYMTDAATADVRAHDNAAEAGSQDAALSAVTEAGSQDATLSATAPGIPDDLWLRREGIPLSKSEVRAVLLSRAQPAGRAVIWDAGAGTGTYGIECALLQPRARVFSIDKNPEACELVKENAARFGAANVEAVCGPAPDIFAGLPTPDLVIIGGNDGRLPQIFAAALEKLAPGGRIVVTALLEQTRKDAHAAFAASGLEHRQSVKVLISRGEAQHWVEHNPVIIFSGDKSKADKLS